MSRIRCLLFLGLILVTASACMWGQVAISVSFGPPMLPVYQQPAIAAPGYIWVPGYWAWSPEIGDYYWVPGTWVLPPQVGYLWTPGYWGYSGNLFYWHPGYWGTAVGYYGGVNYGYGYPGNGYYGGRWQGRQFYYNSAVNNVPNVRYVYNQTVVNNYSSTRVSYNGPGGVQARPTQEQLAAERARHINATQAQTQHEQTARGDRTQFASANRGAPAVVATPRPGALNAPQAVKAPLPQENRSAATNAHANARPPANGDVNRKPATAPAQTQQQARTSQEVPRPPQNENGEQRTRTGETPRPPQNTAPTQRAQSEPRTAQNNAQEERTPQSTARPQAEPPKGEVNEGAPPNTHAQREVQQPPKEKGAPPPHVNNPPARPEPEPKMAQENRSTAAPGERPQAQREATPHQNASRPAPPKEDEHPH